MQNPIAGKSPSGNPKNASAGRIMKTSGPAIPNVSSNAAPKTIVTVAKGR